MTTTEAIRELMGKWNECRAQWIAKHGSDEGFSDWSTQQSTGACGEETLGADDLVRPCVLPVGHSGFCSTGR